MRFYKLLMYDSDDRDVVAYCIDTKGFEQYELSEGKYIHNWNSEITFYFDPKEGERLTDYLANNLGWFIVSERFKAILEKVDDGIQYLPINVVIKGENKILKGFSVANILNVVDALNLENSDYSVFELDGESIYSIKKYALCKEAIQSKHIIKLKGDEIPIFISEELRELIEKNNITGCDFLEVKVI
ncbi:imm11 family protein [Aeribacillus composti]|uniref:imm11 family protein n=1 Tax=Aeribacillus composti TaxID=1868734 RepID=UPI003D21DDF7